MYKNNMQCRICTTGRNETQEHLEKCELTKEMRKTLNLGKREIYEPKSKVNNKKINKKTKTILNHTLHTKPRRAM